MAPGPTDEDPATLSPLTYLLQSGSDRIGALDFQASSDDYFSRQAGTASLEELMQSAQRVEEGIPLSPALDAALLHGSSVGGARPKALLSDGARNLIAKSRRSLTDIPLSRVSTPRWSLPIGSAWTQLESR